MKTQKGITLIALIITIIVMLILVGVSVTVALNTGLFKSAQGAAKNTQQARNEELALSGGTIKIGNKTYSSLEQYINNPEGYDYKIVLKKDGTSVHEIYFNDGETWDDLKDRGVLGSEYEIYVNGTKYGFRFIGDGGYYTSDDNFSWLCGHFQGHYSYEGVYEFLLDVERGVHWNEFVCTSFTYEGEEWDWDVEDMSDKTAQIRAASLDIVVESAL